MKCLAEFEVFADLLPHSDHPELSFRHPNKEFEVILKTERFHPGKSGILNAKIVFETDSLDSASIKGENLLASFLDTLSFVTNSHFIIQEVLRVVDWTPGIEHRKCIQFKHFGDPQLPIQGLTPDILSTVESIENKFIPARIRRAIRWFSYAVSARTDEDRFQYFWFVLELTAQELKTSEKLPSKCPQCREPLYCPKCEKIPVHRPFPKDAILQLFNRIVSDRPDEFFEKATLVRNRLLHGDDINELEHELDRSFSSFVDITGKAAWFSLIACLAELGISMKGTKFLETNRYSNLNVQAGVHMRFRTDPDNPDPHNFPSLTVEMIVSEIDEPNSYD